MSDWEQVSKHTMLTHSGQTGYLGLPVLFNNYLALYILKVIDFAYNNNKS